MCYKYMIIIILIHFLLIITNSNGQSYCTSQNPFRILNGECATFEYVCYKKNDKQCDDLQNACKNCPPSNITLTTLQNILNINKNHSQLIFDGLNNSNKTVNLLHEIKNLVLQNILNIIQSQSPLISDCLKSSNKTIYLIKKIENLAENKNSFSIALSILIIVIILSIVAVIYFLITNPEKLSNFFGNICKFSSKQRRSVSPRNTYSQEIENPTFMRDKPTRTNSESEVSLLPGKLYKDEIYEEIRTNIKEVIDSIMTQRMNDFIAQLQIKTTDNTFCTIRFQFDGIDQESIELHVHNNHNIVQIKQQICAKLLHAKHDDYKIMKLKYNGIILNDDNQYLSLNIEKSNPIVNCFIDSSMNASDIIVVKLQGKMRLPDIIQINKNQTIHQLRELIGKIINAKDFSLFKQSNESIKTEELKVNLNNLKDGDWIRIVKKELGKLIMRSIFEDQDSITIEYVNVDLVSSLMTSISNKYNWDLKKFVLFYNNKCLEAGKYIFEYQISSESVVKYCCFMKWASDINMDDDYITKGNFSELRYGTFAISNRKILIKKYEVKSSKNWKDEEFMLKELITFQITKSQRRFIQLLGVYIDDATLYVVMDNMDKGTLKTFLRENYDKLDKNKIYKWSAQILEGLKFLHENKVIHRDLNPSSILVDRNDDLKLSSFNLSKHLDIYKPCSIMAKRDKKEELPVRYMAPEILNGDKYGEACDVWSFGAVLIRIVTNKKPYSNSVKKEALSIISNLKVIEYKLPDKYSEFKYIIDSCLKYDPSQREKIGKLINNENIGKYIND